jgi:uncharacterized protein
MTSSPIGFGLMCKPPRPGTSKTRLAAGIGNDAAARLSAAFLADCAATVGTAARSTLLDCAAFYRPADAADELAALLGAAWPLQFADHGDLGMTMRVVLTTLLTRCPAGAMIMGADVPLLTPDVIVEAARALHVGTSKSVVIVPTNDGGYCLIGIKSSDVAPHLFDDIQWSTPHVLDDTLRRATAAGLHVALLEPQRDIDDVDDLRWLRQEIERSPGRAVATQAVLSRL